MYGKSSADTFSFLSPSSMTLAVTFLISSSDKFKPKFSIFFFMLALPEVLPKAYFLFLPNLSGSNSLWYKLFLLSPSA